VSVNDDHSERRAVKKTTTAKRNEVGKNRFHEREREKRTRRTIQSRY